MKSARSAAGVAGSGGVTLLVATTPGVRNPPAVRAKPTFVGCMLRAREAVQ